MAALAWRTQIFKGKESGFVPGRCGNVPTVVRKLVGVGLVDCGVNGRQSLRDIYK